MVLRVKWHAFGTRLETHGPYECIHTPCCSIHSTLSPVFWLTLRRHVSTSIVLVRGTQLIVLRPLSSLRRVSQCSAYLTGIIKRLHFQHGALDSVSKHHESLPVLARADPSTLSRSAQSNQNLRPRPVIRQVPETADPDTDRLHPASRPGAPPPDAGRRGREAAEAEKDHG